MIFIMQQIHQKIDNLDDKLTQHIKDETIQLAEEIAKLMLKSFPEGDPDGHRAAHEAWIRREEGKAAFWSKLAFEISKWGLLGFLGWATVSLWHHFLEGPK